MPQLSEEPLLIAAAVTVALPFASKGRVKFGWQVAIGTWFSITVTVMVTGVMLPFPSEKKYRSVVVPTGNSAETGVTA